MAQHDVLTHKGLPNKEQAFFEVLEMMAREQGQGLEKVNPKCDGGSHWVAPSPDRSN